MQNSGEGTKHLHFIGLAKKFVWVFLNKIKTRSVALIFFSPFVSGSSMALHSAVNVQSLLIIN